MPTSHSGRRIRSMISRGCSVLLTGTSLVALASAAQAKATKEVPVSKTLHPRLIIDLMRRPLWLVGIGATVAGLGLQVVALAFGPLLLVQPLLVTALPFA